MSIPAQLPAAVAGFTGRGTELRRLDELLTGTGPSAPPIAVLDGSAGIGKTALAVHWAHRVGTRFPDGQLYADLRGYAPGPPQTPLAVLSRFLQALGVLAEDIPGEVDDASALYRSTLAGKRVLVLLDNAHQADQVRPLVPGAPGCRVLVTSRSQLGGLVARDGAVRVPLDVFTPDESRVLLVHLLGAGRVNAEPEAVGDVAALCGHLPLALRIAAANLTSHEMRTVAAYRAQLRRDRLAALEVSGDEQAAVRAAFDLSYAALPDRTRRVFRLLSAVPGPDITPPVAAALAGVPEPLAHRLLAELATAHLVDEPVPGRYALHDLLRVYAAEQDGEPTAAPLGRLYDCYLSTVDAAASMLYSQLLRLPSEHAGLAAPFADGASASAWLDAERLNLVATILHTAEHGPRAVAWRLADALRGYFYLGTHTVDWYPSAQAGLAAATADGDVRAEAAARLSIATLYFVQGRFRQAIEQTEPALALARASGWTAGESAMLGNLGNMHWSLGEPRQAAAYYEQAAPLHRATGQVGGLATALANLGLVYSGLGQQDEALARQTEALALHREVDSRSGEARTLLALGETLHNVGRLADARENLEQALALHREVGDRNMEGQALRALAALACDLDRPGEALEMAESSVLLARETGDPRSAADALTTRGTVHYRLGRFDEAAADHELALENAVELGARYTEAEALIGLAYAYRHARYPDRALEHGERALRLTREVGLRLLEGDALVALAAVETPAAPRRVAGGRVLARVEEALRVNTAIGNPLGQLRSHVLAEHLLRTAGRIAEADRHRDRATALRARLGVDLAVQARTVLEPS